MRSRYNHDNERSGGRFVPCTSTPGWPCADWLAGWLTAGKLEQADQSKVAMLGPQLSRALTRTPHPVQSTNGRVHLYLVACVGPACSSSSSSHAATFQRKSAVDLPPGCSRLAGERAARETDFQAREPTLSLAWSRRPLDGSCRCRRRRRRRRRQWTF